jgi:hypothetical protein
MSGCCVAAGELSTATYLRWVLLCFGVAHCSS